MLKCLLNVTLTKLLVKYLHANTSKLRLQYNVGIEITIIHSKVAYSSYFSTRILSQNLQTAKINTFAVCLRRQDNDWSFPIGTSLGHLRRNSEIHVFVRRMTEKSEWFSD